MAADSKKENTQQFSNKLFYRVYFILVLCIIIIGSFLDYFIKKNENNFYINELISSNQSSFSLIKDTLQNHDKDNWSDQLERIAKLINTQLNLLNTKDFKSSPQILNILANGETVELYDENDAVSLYQQIANTNLIIELETSKQKPNSFSWIPLIFYSLIALVIFILIQPFAKQLMKLKSASIKIGKGAFSTRLTLPKTSTLYPIADAFDTMTEEIENLMLRQRDLTNAVSHELRTPLSRLKFAFEELEINSNNTDLIENINDMKLDVSELENLIDEMLLYAQANQIKELEQKNIRVMELINDLVQSTHPNNIKLLKKYDSNININTVIFADEHSMFRALSNILRNSLSFSIKTCCLNVSLSSNILTIQIIDDGPGIDRGILGRVFEPFVKIDNSKRKSGYGLGLAIAKSIITKHKGKISVTNGSPKGAIFTISLPIS